MKEGPDISQTAALIGDPARANILTALMTGKALTATELAAEAGITPPTASGHLRKLEDGGLIKAQKQGRHKYFILSGPQIAALLEALMGFATAHGHLRSRTGPKDAALRAARVCYDHLAGEAGVRIYDSMLSQGLLTIEDAGLSLSPQGNEFIAALGLDLVALRAKRSPLCRECLDWSERRSHLAGTIGRELFDMILRRGWARREDGTRVVQFTTSGKSTFDKTFSIAPDVSRHPKQIRRPTSP